MLDIGVVYYRIRTSGNVIDAIWHSTRLGRKEVGRGIANGDTSNGFPGDYVVTCYYPDGSEAGTFDLKIEKTGPVYDLSYRVKGELLFVGVGIEASDGLAAGYRKVEGNPSS
jgi:hypothetical protein